jgi:DNA-3-methyladenine glycosylase I
MERCGWVKPENAHYVDYHDQEWGVPVHDDRQLFEMLILEGAQAGLSWETILNKRENYRLAFDYFDPLIISEYDDAKIEQLMQNAGIVRNRLKIKATIKNAKVFMAIQKEFGSFDHYLWDNVDGKPIVNTYKSLAELPAKTELSDKLSKDLKKRGMSFVGTTIIYAFLQAVGVVNDHTINCFRHQEVML